MDSNLAFKFDLEYFDENEQEMHETLKRAVNLLCDHASHPSILFNNQDIFDAFIFVGKAINNYDIDFQIFNSKNIGEFISNLNFYLHAKRNEIQFNLAKELEKLDKVKKLASRAQKKYAQNEKHVVALGYSFFLSMVLFRNSNEVFVEFLKKDGLNSLASFISDEMFLKEIKNVTINDPTNKPIGFIDYLVLNFAHISTKTLHEFNKQWTDLDLFNKLLNIVKIDNSLRFHIYLTIVNIAEKKQFSNLIDIEFLVKNITQLLLQAKRDFNSGDFHRFKRQIYINGKLHVCDIHSVKDVKSINISIKVLLECLSKLLVEDKIKAEVYFKLDLKDCVKAFLSKGKFFFNFFQSKIFGFLKCKSN